MTNLKADSHPLPRVHPQAHQTRHPEMRGVQQVNRAVTRTYRVPHGCRVMSAIMEIWLEIRQYRWFVYPSLWQGTSYPGPRAVLRPRPPALPFGSHLFGLHSERLPVKVPPTIWGNSLNWFKSKSVTFTVREAFQRSGICNFESSNSE